ncbi:MAG: hypothetical protein NWR47_07605, partial [Aestuariivirgaceae bacterium]|nr:hypothetical protein [Aestuariivirgaceae bacterium]
MPQAFTRAQIEELEIDRSRPLVICDVDEVVVHFIQGFEAHLEAKGFSLEFDSFALNGNVRHRHSGQSLPGEAVSAQVMEFFASSTRHQKLIPGAVEALNALSDHAEIVMLTNLPGEFRQERIENLMGHGLHHPVVVNAGPKGPAVRLLTQTHAAPVVFIDDSPSYLESVYEHNPDCRLIHFLQDERLMKVAEPMPW